jgi:hypothetical protein
MHLDVPSHIHHQQAQPLIHPQPSFTHQEFQPQTNIQSGPTTIHLESPNRLSGGQTILMGPPHESPMRVGLPVHMMPPGAQLIQLQQHPHGQSLQVVQRVSGKLFIKEKEHFLFIVFLFQKKVQCLIIVRSFIKCLLVM